jgi:hypothetical protein
VIPVGAIFGQELNFREYGCSAAQEWFEFRDGWKTIFEIITFF